MDEAFDDECATRRLLRIGASKRCPSAHPNLINRASGQLTVNAVVSPRWFQFADPDVAVAHRMIVVLQRQREFFRPKLVRGAHMMPSGPGEFDVVLHEHAIVKNRFARGARQFSGGIKTRAMKNDVVSLPLARRTRSVH